MTAITDLQREIRERVDQQEMEAALDAITRSSSMTVCPWCDTRLHPGEPTATHRITRWHAGCLEDHERTDREADHR